MKDKKSKKGKSRISRYEWKILIMAGVFVFYEIFAVILWDVFTGNWNPILYLYLGCFNAVWWTVMFYVFRRML